MEGGPGLVAVADHAMPEGHLYASEEGTVLGEEVQAELDAFGLLGHCHMVEEALPSPLCH